MRLTVDYKLLLLHLGITLFIFISPTSIIFIPIIISLTIFFYIKKLHINVVLTAFYSILCKGETVYFVFAITLLFLTLIDKCDLRLEKNRYPIITIYNRMKLLILYCVILYIIQFFISPSPFSLPFFFLTFLSYFLLTFYIWKNPFGEKKLSKLIMGISYIGISQAFIALFIQAIPVGIGTILNSPGFGDNLVGTSNSGTTSSSVMLFSIIPLLFFVLKDLKKITEYIGVILLITFVLFVVYLSDAKTILFATLLALMMRYVLVNFVFKLIKPSKALFIGIASIFLVFIATNDINKIITDRVPEFELYTEGYFNSKYVYYAKTFDYATRDPITFVLGTGGGTNGSRAANALAYDKLAKSENSTKVPSIIPAKTNEFTEKHISNLYDEEYIERLFTVSAIVASPFNSICSLFIELGIIGSLLYIAMIYYIFLIILFRNNIITKSLVTYLLTVLIIAFVFPSLEYPSMQLFVFLHLGLSYHTYKTNI